MPENLSSGYTKLIYSATTFNATANTPTFTLPVGESYSFILDVGTPSGTSETMDAALQISPDGGTTWYDWARFAQVTTSVVSRRLNLQPLQGRGEAGSEAVITAAATGAINTNVPMPIGVTNACRFALTLGGTTPSYATVKIWMVVSARAAAV